MTYIFITKCYGNLDFPNESRYIWKNTISEKYFICNDRPKYIIAEYNEDDYFDDSCFIEDENTIEIFMNLNKKSRLQNEPMQLTHDDVWNQSIEYYDGCWHFNL